MYLAKLCCDYKDVFLVNGHSWSRSCRLAVGVVGVIGTFSLPLLVSFPVQIPVQSSVLSANGTVTSLFLAVMAGDCGDEISSKSQTAISRCHVMRDFRDSSQSSLFFL